LLDKTLQRHVILAAQRWHCVRSLANIPFGSAPTDNELHQILALAFAGGPARASNHDISFTMGNLQTRRLGYSESRHDSQAGLWKS